MASNVVTRAHLRGAGSIDRATDSIVDTNLAVLHSYDSADIISIQFSLTTYEDMQRQSVVTITEPAKNPSGVERHTPHDPGLGVVRNRASCSTCAMDAGGCNGHFGIIEFHTFLAPHEKGLQKILRQMIGILCAGCGRPVLDDNALSLIRDEVELQRSSMLPADWHDLLISRIYADSTNMICSYRAREHEHVNGVLYPLNPKTEAFTHAAVVEGTLEKGKKAPVVTYELEFFYRAMERLTVAQLYFLGYAERTRLERGEWVYTINAHPSALIGRAIPVTPLCSRAPTVGEVSTLFHPHTKAYNTLVSMSSLVKAAKDQLSANSTIDEMDGRVIPRVTEDVWRRMKEELEDRVSQLYRAHNEMSETIFKGILSNKKTGLVRNEGQGKVVMHIGRAPVVPDPRNRAGQVSVPRKSASKMSVRVMVTASNLSEIMNLLRDGKVKYIYPHTAIVAGTSIQVTALNLPHLSVQIGDYVSRDLQDGDMLLFIRQPALAGLSSIAGMVRLWDYDAYGFSLEETAERAMDFDGDEVNAQAPQTEDAAAELSSILAVENVLIHSKDQRIVFGAVQDAILGANIMTMNPLQPGDVITEDKGWVTREEFDRITALVSPTAQSEISKKGRELGIKSKMEDFRRRLTTHGKVFSRVKEDGTEVIPTDVLISWAFPPDTFYTRAHIVIQDGVLIRGLVGKDVIGSSQDTYVHEIATYSRKRAIDTITDTKIIATAFLSRYGMSAGWSDCAPILSSSQKQLGEILIDMYAEIDGIRPATDDIDARRYEAELENAVQKASGRADELIHSAIDPNNRIMKIISSGTKGTERHIYNIVGMLGQQYSAGRLPAKMLSGGTRHTSYFDVDDREPTGMGMCTSSLSEGITPAEAIFVAAAARKSFMNLNISTPTIGKTSNEMYRVLQSVISNSAGGCMDGDILVSALYGGDGLAAKQLKRIRQPNSLLSLRFVNLDSLTERFNAERGWYKR